MTHAPTCMPPISNKVEINGGSTESKDDSSHVLLSFDSHCASAAVHHHGYSNGSNGVDGLLRSLDDPVNGQEHP